jgi:hypothetical protein
MSSKLRVYEVARELSLDNKAIVSLLQSMGFGEVRNHMSVVSSDAVERLRRHQERKAEPKVVEERIRPTVVKRRSVAKPAETAAPAPVESIPEPPVRVAPARAEVVRRPAATKGPEPVPPPRESRPSSDVPAVATAVRTESAVPETAPVTLSSAELASESIAASTPALQDEGQSVPVETVDLQAQAAPAPSVEFSPSDVSVSAAASSAQAVADTQVAPTPIARPMAAAPAPATESADRESAAREQAVARSKERPSTPPAPGSMRPSSPPRTGIEVWEGRPGVPMTPPHRGPVPRRVQYDAKAGAGNLQRRPGQPAPRQPQRGTRGRTSTAVTAQGLLGAKARLAAVPLATERGAHKRVVKIEGSIGLQTLAGRMGI